MIQTPDWAKDAIYLRIFPDRLAISGRASLSASLEPWESIPARRGHKGGGITGMPTRFDYLVDLGASAHYFNPIFQSAADHGHHTHDDCRVDPVLGDNQAFR